MQASKIKIVPFMAEIGFSFMMNDFGMIQWRVIGLLKNTFFTRVSPKASMERVDERKLV
jgi:hypothetical protein